MHSDIVPRFAYLTVMNGTRPSVTPGRSRHTAHLVGAKKDHPGHEVDPLTVPHVLAVQWERHEDPSEELLAVLTLNPAMTGEGAGEVLMNNEWWQGMDARRMDMFMCGWMLHENFFKVMMSSCPPGLFVAHQVYLPTRSICPPGLFVAETWICGRNPRVSDSMSLVCSLLELQNGCRGADIRVCEMQICADHSKMMPAGPCALHPA